MKSRFTMIFLLIALTTPVAVITWAQTDEEKAKQQQEEEQRTEQIYAKIEEAEKLIRKGRYKKAIQVYKEIIELDPENWPDIYYMLGQLTAAEGMPGDCVMYYTRYLYIVRSAEDRNEIEREIKKCASTMEGSGGYLSVPSSDPPEIVVAINGLDLFYEPVERFPLMPGSYQITAMAADFTNFNRKITITKGETTTITPNLKKIVYQGTIILKINEDGATVSIDGKVVGTSPIEPMVLDEGKYFLEITKSGYDKWIRNLVVEREDQLIVNIFLEKTK